MKKRGRIYLDMYVHVYHGHPPGGYYTSLSEGYVEASFHLHAHVELYHGPTAHGTHGP